MKKVFLCCGFILPRFTFVFNHKIFVSDIFGTVLQILSFVFVHILPVFICFLLCFEFVSLYFKLFPCFIHEKIVFFCLNLCFCFDFLFFPFVFLLLFCSHSQFPGLMANFWSYPKIHTLSFQIFHAVCNILRSFAYFSFYYMTKHGFYVKRYVILIHI